MRLPEIRYRTGVASLGRENIRGPGVVAEAEARTAYGWARALDVASGVVDDFYRANAAAEYDKAIADYTRQEQELRTLLMSGPTIDTEQHDIPDWVDVRREDTTTGPNGDTTTTPRRFIPTHEVAQQTYDGMLERWASTAMEGTSNPLARSQLAQNLPKLANKNRAAVMAKQMQFFREQQSAMTEVAINDHIASGNELAARATAMRGLQTGNLDAAKFPAIMERIGQEIDQGIYQRLIMEAETPEELEVVEDLIARGVVPDVDPSTGEVVYRDSRLTGDQQWRQFNNVETLRERADERREEAQKERMSELTAQRARGQLTQEQAIRELESDNISHTQFLNLESQIAKGTMGVLKNNPVVVDRFRGRIRSLRYLPEGERISDRARTIREDIQAAYSGMRADGTPAEQSINAEGLEELQAAVDDERNRIRKNPAIADGYREIEGIVKFSPVYGKTEPSGSAAAYVDFKNAYDDYIDRMGDAADPQAYINANKARFDPETYSQGFIGISDRYPEYTPIIENVDESNPQAVRDAKDQIRAMILKQWRARQISQEDARIRFIQLGGPVPDSVYDAAVLEDMANVGR